MIFPIRLSNKIRWVIDLMQKLTFFQKWPITPTLSKSWHIFPNYAQLTPQQAKEHSAKMYVFPEIVNHVDHSLSCIAKIVLFDKKTVFLRGVSNIIAPKSRHFFVRGRRSTTKKSRGWGVQWRVTIQPKTPNSSQMTNSSQNEKFSPECPSRL